MTRRLIPALALLALLAPMTARADDAATAVTAQQPVAATLQVDQAAQTQALALISKRLPKLGTSRGDGEIALNPDGSPLWKLRAYVPLMPASTMKVVTAAVALHVMGPNWKPITRIDFDANTRTLTLVGGGDPQLTSTQLGQLADRAVQALAERGDSVARITIDDSLFPAPVLQRGVSAGQQPFEERPVRALVVDRVRSKDSGLDAGKRLRTMLATRGVLAPFKGREASQGTQIASIEGYRLQSTLKTMLWYSDNDIAEMAFRLSALAVGKDATWEGARAAALETLAAMGVPTKHLVLVDGSGLSRSNRLTADAIARTLAAADAGAGTSMLASLLPAAGVEGTLRTRYSSAPAKCVKGSLKAKTGSLHDVISLAGYAPTASGTHRAFAIIVNKVHNSAGARNRTRAAVDGLAAAFSGC